VATERPILFSASMVRALLAGAKTQTRRIVTVPWRGSSRALPYEPYWVDTDGVLQFCDEYGDYTPWVDVAHPYGVPGDRLWVKETFIAGTFNGGDRDWVRYRATDDNPSSDADKPRWKPSIFMPRKLSRLTLEIVVARVERLTAITEEDAKAEGARCLDLASGREAILGQGSYRDHFRYIWDEINGEKAPWSTNPWVWAIDFKPAPAILVGEHRERQRKERR
jgi:hypothetical protein